MPMEPKRRLPVPPRSCVAVRVLAAAVPMGYSRSDSSTKRLRMSAHATRPSRVPASATPPIWSGLASASSPSIQMPGIVNARPPATMEPADMMIWVMLASFRLLRPNARSRTSAVMDVKMVGQGSAPILSAVYTDEAVMMTQPTRPMTIPAALSCPRSSARLGAVLICMLLRISAPPPGESGFGTNRYSIGN